MKAVVIHAYGGPEQTEIRRASRSDSRETFAARLTRENETSKSS